jgi:tetratricopeptide (TPR) repeat protein
MGKILKCSGMLICITFLAGCGMAQRGAMIWAYSDIEKGKYESALQNLSEAEGYEEPAPELKAEILYLRAVCYANLGRRIEAVGTLKYIIDKFPDSSYAYQAKETLLQLEKPPKTESPPVSPTIGHKQI